MARARSTAACSGFGQHIVEKDTKSLAGERDPPLPWSGHTNVPATKRWYVKPDVEDLREASTTWDGLHGVSTQSCEKLRDVRPCRA
ncbi:hypothetical protein CG723_02430 [Streptomyces sp. CB01635]|nr:hypothetical protein CG723_02430 [Streptomyces sp. CB01635]